MAACFMSGQSSHITVSPKKARGFYKRLKSSTLIVPLSDKPTHEDSALVQAVTLYWKASAYKFISETELVQIIKSKSKPANYVYLVEETYQRFKHKRMDWAQTKCYISSEPDGAEMASTPFLEFKLPVKTRNNEVSYPDYSYLYPLIVKHFNRETELMSDEENYKKIKRRTLIKADFKRELKEYSSKMMFTTENDFENYAMNLPDDMKKASLYSSFTRYISKKTGMDTSHIRIVDEEKILNAVVRNDPNALVYTGFTVYNAQDAKLLRRIDVSSRKRKQHAVMTTGISGILLAAAILIFF
jgi:hypothetical protein